MLRTLLIAGALVLLFASATPHASAATNNPSAAYALTGPTQTARGQLVHILVSVTSTDTAINAAQGTITFPPRMMTVEDIQFEHSIIKHWQHSPNADNVTGHIAFTGGLPTPGFQGTNGKLFTIIARPTAVGTLTLASTSDSIALANDTKGTILATKQAAVTISVTEQATKPIPSTTPALALDTTPPTDLEVLIGRDPHLFNNAWFAAFQATDAESGIDYYEIAETKPHVDYPAEHEWTRTRSPQVLRNQSQRGHIFIKAVDRAGNATVTSTHFIPYRTTPWWVLLIVGIAIALCIYAARRHAKSQN